MKTTFTKADLKTGHRVTTRNGQVWTVMKDVPVQSKGCEEEDEGIFVYNRGWMDIKGLDEGFVYNTDKDYSLVKVEQVDLYCDYLSTLCGTTVLWEREAPKSKEQIAYEDALAQLEIAKKKVEALNPANK